MPDSSRHSKLLRLGALAALSAVVAQGCGETLTQVSEDDVVEVRMSADSADVAVGRELQLRAYPLDGSGALLVGQGVSWQSLDATVASVDEAGLVSGEAEGETKVVAQVAAFADTTVVTVELPPTLSLSEDSIAFEVVAGGSDPAPQAVDVTNAGGFPLVGLAVDSIVYGPVASGWLAGQLDGPSAPAILEVTASTTGLTTAGTYTASVWLSAIDADGSPAEVEVTLEVDPATAASLTINDGDGQTAVAGSAVATAPSVLLTDAFDNPIAGASVGFSVSSGGGSVDGAPATTDAAGVARVGSWTLGTVVGDNELTATFGVLAPVTFAATGVPGPAAQVVVTAGDNQSAVAGAAVATPPSVTVQDTNGNGVAGVAVTFTVASGGGSVTGGSQTSDADGIATVGSWTLGTTAGTNTLDVSAEGVGTGATITATGLSGEAAAVQLEAGDAQSDTVAATLPMAYVVKVVDSNLNGVEGVPVTWTVTGGGGTIGGSGTAVAIETDQDGLSTAVRILGTTPGTHTVSAAVGGLNSVSFTATAAVGSPYAIVINAGDAQTDTVRAILPIDPQVRVTDRFDNPIAGHSVTFSVTGSDGIVVPTTAITTAADGTATVTSWQLGTATGAGNNALRATAAGPGIDGQFVTLTASATAGSPTSVAPRAGTANITTVIGQPVATSPRVAVLDQFGNGVPGQSVTFSPSSGGSVGISPVVTDPSGEAGTSWFVGASGVMSSTGTFTNTLTASTAGIPSFQFSVPARYSYGTHVEPIWGGCTGCHGSWTYDALVGVQAFCSATVYRVQLGGGVAAADNSALLQKLDPALPGPGTCGSHTGGSESSTNLAIIRAWIRNSAPDN